MMMRNRLVILLVCVSLLSGNTLLAAARELPRAANTQQTFPEDPEIEQMREDVRRLEEKDKDPNLSPGVKALNRRFIGQRTQALLERLKTTLKSLRDYRTEMKSELSVAENGLIEARIQAYEQEIQARSSDVASATADTRPLRADPPPTDPRRSTESTRPTADTTGGSPATPARQQRSAPAQTGTNPPAGTRGGLSTVPPSKLADGAQTGTMKLTSLDLQPCASFDPTTPNTFSLLSKYVCDWAETIRTDKNTNPGQEYTQDEHLFQIALVMIAKMDRPALLLEAEESRTDKQVGAGPSASGTTSLTVKGGVPTVLGIAVENGALAQSTSGTTITFRGNPYGIAQALASKGFIQSYDESQKNGITKFLKNSSFAFSFDTTRGNPEGTNVFTGDKQQLSAMSFRYVFVDHRDPRRPEYTAAFEKLLNDEGSTFAVSAARMFDAFYTKAHDFKDPALLQWSADTKAAILAASANQVEDVLKQRLGLLPVDSLSPETVDSLKRLRTDFAGYLKARDAVLNTVAKGTVVSVEYTNNREVNSPDLSNITFIAQKGMGGRFDGTLNGSITWFNRIPAGGTRRVRDFSFSGQGDISLGDLRGIGNLILSFSGRYEHLQENAMTPDGMVMMDTKGDLIFGQAKLTIPIKNLGVKMPISFTVSNRTELIKEKEVKGNIGFTFDLDSIFAKFKP